MSLEFYCVALLSLPSFLVVFSADRVVCAVASHRCGRVSSRWRSRKRRCRGGSRRSLRGSACRRRCTIRTGSTCSTMRTLSALFCVFSPRIIASLSLKYFFLSFVVHVCVWVRLRVFCVSGCGQVSIRKDFRGSPVLIGRLPGRRPSQAKSVLLNGHVDVVPVGEPPFSVRTMCSSSSL